jgi:hypothetical protein
MHSAALQSVPPDTPAVVFCVAFLHFILFMVPFSPLFCSTRRSQNTIGD